MADTYTETLDRRQLSLLRLAQSIIKDTANPALEEAYRAARLAILDRDEPTTAKQMEALKKAMADAYEKSLAESFEEVTTQLYELGIVESAFLAKTMDTFSPESFSEPADKVVKRYIENSVMQFHGKKDNAFTWGEYLNTSYGAAAKNMRSSVSAVWLEQSITGKLPTLNDYVNRIKITNDGVNKRDLQTIVRTGVNHFSTEGRASFYKDNEDVIDTYYLNVTFDNRVSKICVSAGAKYGPGSGGSTWGEIPKPPLHPNCRTAIIAVSIGQDIEGERQAIEGRKGKGAVDNFEARKERLRTKSKVQYKGKSDNAFYAKEVSAATPISKFLRDQPAWYIDDVLGKEVGKAFRSGKLNLSELTDKNLKPLTIEELGIN